MNRIVETVQYANHSLFSHQLNAPEQQASVDVDEVEANLVLFQSYFISKMANYGFSRFVIRLFFFIIILFWVFFFFFFCVHIFFYIHILLCSYFLCSYLLCRKSCSDALIEASQNEDEALWILLKRVACDSSHQESSAAVPDPSFIPDKDEVATQRFLVPSSFLYV
jgi:hypothetical protein